MKITRVEPIHLRLPEVTERCDGSQETLIVKVHTDAGITGIGEVDSSSVVAKAIIEAPLSHKICRGLADCVLGQDPFEIDRLIHRMYEGTIYFGRQGAVIQAMSGIEIALWDIMGKATGRPVYQLLGGAFRKKLRAYASILFGDTPAETERIGRSLVQQGFRAVKFGWGPMGQSEESDLALVEAARRGLGPEVELMVDAGLCWDTATAIRRAKQFEPFRLTWLEEPLHPDNLAGYARLSAQSPVRIAAGEEICDIKEFQQMMDIGGIDVVQVDVTRVGGLARSKRIGWDSHERHRLCVNHSYKTGVNIAASLHFVAALPNSQYFEYCVEAGPLRQTLTKQKVPVVDGDIAVPEDPGLGIELDENVVEKFRVK
ncbi:MAG TPA: mandelate racemase/muconate lactonizing enzyme family protein [Gemmataceae bacterium]|jgi:L-alanine-DL-glutamate epimerase-like enolase superfamily enzyme|nr:mandelate racemase/muconate lactonizing enzyme family protein [Gemmataceae bacterium]